MEKTIRIISMFLSIATLSLMIIIIQSPESHEDVTHTGAQTNTGVVTPKPVPKHVPKHVAKPKPVVVSPKPAEPMPPIIIEDSDTITTISDSGTITVPKTAEKVKCPCDDKSLELNNLFTQGQP